MSIRELFTNVALGEQGIWKTNTIEGISYTKNGHDLIKENEKKSFWFHHRLNCLKKVIDTTSIKNDIVLDVGGGNGHFSLYLQSLSANTVLIEPGVSGAFNAVENGVQNVINGTLKDANFKDESFDTITLLDVLEHIEDDKEFLVELYRIMKPKAKLILTVPAFQFLFSSFDKEVGHYRRYTLKDLSNKLTQSGFSIDYKTYFFSLLPIPLYIGRFFINKLRKKEKRKGTGHINKSGVLGSVLRILLSPELLLIKNKVRIPLGSSCLMIVHKPETNGE